MIRDAIIQIKTTKPAVCQVEVDLFTEPALGSDAKTIAHQKHADQKLGIDRRAACVAVEIRQMRADTAQIDEPINRSQQVILRDMIFKRKLIEQRWLCFRSRPLHSSILPLTSRIESADQPSIKQEFFNKISPRPDANFNLQCS